MQVDHHRSGKVTLHEFRRAIRRLESQLKESDVDSFMLALDTVRACWLQLCSCRPAAPMHAVCCDPPLLAYSCGTRVNHQDAGSGHDSKFLYEPMLRWLSKRHKRMTDPALLNVLKRLAGAAVYSRLHQV
eukprot:SAG22_NODE_577_length_8975_cov_12.406827_3_plen_130_part_00